MKNFFQEFLRARILATGTDLATNQPTLIPSCNSEDELNSLIQKYYVFYNEEMWGDINFLTNYRKRGDLQGLRNHLYNLRTSFSHSDNQQAAEYAKKWRSRFSSCQEAASSLSEKLERALEEVAGLAISASRDKSKSDQWKERVALKPYSIFEAVERDLGKSFTKKNRARMVRNVEKIIEIKNPRNDRKSAIADFCAQEILSSSSLLPVSYPKVLEMLGLLGHYDAPGAVRIAYSIADVNPSLKGERFLTRVRQVWDLATAKEVS